MNWMEEFIGQCLAEVPEGGCRTRTEKELEDHLLSLCRSLEQAGYPPEEARVLAASRMGNAACHLPDFPGISPESRYGG